MWKLVAPTIGPTSSWLLSRSTAISWLNEEDTISSWHLWWGPPAPTFWDHCYDVPMKSQNKVWVFEDEKVPVQVRKSKSIGKRMVAMFFTKGGILTTISLEKSKTVTAK